MSRNNRKCLSGQVAGRLYQLYPAQKHLTLPRAGFRQNQQKINALKTCECSSTLFKVHMILMGTIGTIGTTPAKLLFSLIIRLYAVFACPSTIGTLYALYLTKNTVPSQVQLVHENGSCLALEELCPLDTLGAVQLHLPLGYTAAAPAPWIRRWRCTLGLMMLLHLRYAFGPCAAATIPTNYPKKKNLGSGRVGWGRNVQTKKKPRRLGRGSF